MTSNEDMKLLTSEAARRAFTYGDGPRNVYWETTIACSLACKHCRAEAISRRDPDELVGDTALDLLRSVKELGSMLVLTGGDPIERPDLFDLIGSARDLHIPIGVTPSTTPKLGLAHLARFREAGVAALGLSLDGATRESHDAFRGVPGTFERARAVLGYARDVGLPVQVNTTVSTRNLDELVAIYRLLLEEAPPVKRWSLFLLVPTGRGRNLDLPEPEELEKLYAWIYERGKDSPFHISTVEAPMYRRYLAERKLAEGESVETLIARGSRYGFGIRDGNGVIFVSHRGDVYPSGFVPMVRLGNVRETPLHEIYRSSKALVELRDMDRLKGKCGVCEYRWLCGGSRARSSSLGGDAMAPEPLCAYRPAAEFEAPAKRARRLNVLSN